MTNKSTERIEQRPTSGQLVVPYVVDETRSPIDFKELDLDHIEKCARYRKCGICGKRIHSLPLALIGPDDGRRCFADPWMHIDCARLAMQQCPFLAARKDWREPDSRSDPLIQTYSHNMVLFISQNARSHKDPKTKHWHFESVGTLRRDIPHAA